MKECKVCGQQVEDTMSVCDRCDDFTNKTNRSLGQTKFLLQLVNNDWEKLKQLEMQIKNCFYSACPADKDEADGLMYPHCFIYKVMVRF